MKPRKATDAPLDRRLLNDKAGAPYCGMSRSQFRSLVAAGVIPRVVVPAADGRPLRKLLVDVRDLDRLIEVWKQKGEVKHGRF